MRRKLINVHIPDLGHLAERVRHVKILKKEKEKYRNERRLKSKSFSRKDRAAYMAVESSNEEVDLEAEVDLAELKKGHPYVSSLLKKIPNNEKSNNAKLKSGNRYSFDISKFDQIFDVLLKDKQLILQEGRTLLLVKDLKGKPYCKFYQATSHLTNNCVRFKDLILEAIMEGRLKFDDGKKELKVDSDPFDTEASFVEPYFTVNMVVMSYDFNMALGDFESNVCFVYPSVGDGLLEFLMQQKLKDQDVSLCPRCNAVFDAEAAATFDKYRMKKELAHREEQARQKHPIRRVEGQSSSEPHNGGIEVLLEVGILTSVAVPECIRGVEDVEDDSHPKCLMLTRLRGNTIYEEYFEEGEDEMVSTISIIPTEYLGEYEGNPVENYDVDDEETFSFIRYEDEPGYFQRPSEKQKSHLRPLHITTTMSGIKINKVLIDGGAAISLLPERMLMKVLNSFNCEGCYLTLEGLSVKLRRPHITVPPSGWDCAA
ncbi:hypothetical protein Ahy_B07g086297 [Arachis hypogaea]|uniref:Uncharacterized protein n=1 Tax=Arachis hypogaea TaxID=3818 RepID=A0A444Y9P4_ARAHY|nr:hypothetical protein Ahy_B07g086297 [Arachis hypogaea]